MAHIYVGIGSNLGDRRGNCRLAVLLLGEYGIRVLEESSLYETEPWGVADQPRFLNMAVGAETDLSPRQALAALKEIERRLGRTEGARWGPRAVDLDILLYDGLVVDEPDLTVPHPRMHERAFVLVPLREIAPEAVHPVLKRTIRAIASDFPPLSPLPPE